MLKAAGSDLKHFTPEAKEAMRTAMCGVMYHVYDAGIEAGRTEKLQQQRVEMSGMKNGTRNTSPGQMATILHEWGKYLPPQCVKNAIWTKDGNSYTYDVGGAFRIEESELSEVEIAT